MSSEAETPKITLHWLEKSRAQRILWLLEEINVPYEIKTYKRDPKTHLADPALKEIHPLGKSPVVTIGDLALAESALIVEYLSEHFGAQLIPTKWKAGLEGKVGGETAEYMRYRYFMHYCEGSLMSLLLLSFVSNSQYPFSSSFPSFSMLTHSQTSKAPPYPSSSAPSPRRSRAKSTKATSTPTSLPTLHSSKNNSPRPPMAARISAAPNYPERI